MAEKRTINIDINNNAEEAAKDFQDFAKATNVANDSVEGLNKTFEEVYGELQPLTTRMGEAEDRLYELALAGDTTSKEYQELLKNVGNYRKTQIQTDLAVDQAAQTMSQKLGGALTGATSGFAAVQGAMALVGSESEALEQTLLKVQGALALQQGVQGVLDYTKSIGLAGKATKVFNLIVKANPLALLATAIVGIIGYFALFTDAIDFAIQGLKNLGDAIGLTNFAEEELAAERQKRFEENIARYEEEQRQIEYTSRIRQQSYDNELALLESLGKSTLKLRKQKVDADLEEINAIYEKRKLQLEELDNISKKRKLTSQEIEIQRVLNLGLQKGGKFQTERNALLIQSNKIERELANERKKNAAARKKRQEDEQKRLEKLNEERIKQLDAEKAILQEGVDFLKEANFEEVESTFNKYAAMGEISMEYHKKEQERRERNKEFAINSAFETLDLISNITELFGKKGEKQAKRAFEVQKAAQIATTLGTTYLSATQAYASQFLPLPDPSSPVRGGIAAGLAVAAGLANVAKIASQKFEGGGATGGTSVSGSVPDAPTAPQFNVVGDSGVNQLAQLQQQPTQAYVVSGEVTTAQALDRNRVQNATL
jgi:hypothetical protein